MDGKTAPKSRSCPCGCGVTNGTPCELDEAGKALKGALAEQEEALSTLEARVIQRKRLGKTIGSTARKSTVPSGTDGK